MAKKYRKLKLTPTQKKVLSKIKKRQVKNIEKRIRIGGHLVPHPRTGKPVTAVYLNISNAEAAQFRPLEKKGLISAFGKPEAFTNFKLTEKGKFQLKRRR